MSTIVRVIALVVATVLLTGCLSLHVPTSKVTVNEDLGTIEEVSSRYHQLEERLVHGELINSNDALNAIIGEIDRKKVTIAELDANEVYKYVYGGATVGADDIALNRMSGIRIPVTGIKKSINLVDLIYINTFTVGHDAEIVLISVDRVLKFAWMPGTIAINHVSKDILLNPSQATDHLY